jgi:polyribonucleotide nucleotidyltransferase
MANVTFAKQAKPGQDFFPLTVHYQERYYAAGKVPGGFFKREARPSEKETLTSRLIDRPIRPLFVDGFKNEVLVICTVLSPRPGQRARHGRDDRGLGGADHLGRALHGPDRGGRVGFERRIRAEPRLRGHAQAAREPRAAARPGRRRHRDAVMMVESEAYELSEAEMLGAVKFAHESIQPVIDLIIDLAEDCAKEPFDFTPPGLSALYDKVKAAGEAQMRAAFAIRDKQERVAAIAAAREAAKARSARRSWPTRTSARR